MSRSHDKVGRKVFFFLAISFVIIGLISLYVRIQSGLLFQDFDFTIISMPVMFLCLAYLYPQFRKNDERTKKIRERGSLICFFTIIYILTFQILFLNDMVASSGYQAMNILLSLITVTIFTLFVILSFKY